MNADGEVRSIEEGIYLYCIINSGNEESLGGIGIDGKEVYTVSHRDIAAVVHRCRAEPYGTVDNEKAAEWILAHNYVIDRSTKEFNTVIPFSFDTIIRGRGDTLRDWLGKNYGDLKSVLNNFKEKSEYSIQIFCDRDRLEEKIAGCDPEIAGLKEKMKNLSKGAAYLFTRKFELKIKDAISIESSRLSREFCSVIKGYADEMKVEEKPLHVPEKFRNKYPVVTLSCLVHKDKVGQLGELLGEINKRDGYAVRFTGPWAPFSFVRGKRVEDGT